jgi:MFS family permease
MIGQKGRGVKLDELDDRLRGDRLATPNRLKIHQNWLVVALLALMFAMSLIDRLILSVLANPVAQSLRIADSQLGLLMGTSFAVLYALASLPMGQWIDSYNRKRLVVIGVALWGAMTVASAFAANFTMLLIARSGVAFGEAVLTPAAVSLIADLFIKERRALPMTIYSSAGAVMGTAAFVAGGMALAFAGQIAGKVGLEPWRLTFIMAGAPGLVLALIFLILVREPMRTGRKSGDADDVDLMVFLRYFRKHWWFYVPLLASSGAFCLFIYSMLSWTPTIMVRAHGFKPADASFVLGALITPLQVAALGFWPWLAMRIERKHLYQGVPLSLLFASLWALPFFIFAPLMTDRTLFVGGICLSIITSAAWAVLLPLGFQIFGPSRMRGRLSALSLVAMNLVGYGSGPVLTVYFGHLWEGVNVPAEWGLATDPLARGLATNGLIAVPIMIICTFICVRTAKRLPIV